jgi:hypothetical protein
MLYYLLKWIFITLLPFYLNFYQQTNL